MGIADSDGDAFTGTAWSGLGVRSARAVAPYDVALTSPADPGAAGLRRRQLDRGVSAGSCQDIVGAFVIRKVSLCCLRKAAGAASALREKRASRCPRSRLRARESR